MISEKEFNIIYEKYEKIVGKEKVYKEMDNFIIRFKTLEKNNTWNRSRRLCCKRSKQAFK